MLNEITPNYADIAFKHEGRRDRNKEFYEIISLVLSKSAQNQKKEGVFILCPVSGDRCYNCSTACKVVK